jgi:tRNA threonylcarbamoyl adenosine modification protein (Sua5/YciO/YrdC/YwlC family)
MKQDIETAAQFILNNGVILVPTDTNYALATNPWNEKSCAQLYSIKKRDIRKPLTLFIAEPNEIYQYIDLKKVDKQFLTNIIHNYWPGPLNLVLPKSANAPSNIYFDSDTISIVCNINPILQSIIRAVNMPLGLSSANISGTEIDGIIDFELAAKTFQNEIDYIITSNAETLNTSTSSTIISITQDEIKVLRQGDIVV